MSDFLGFCISIYLKKMIRYILRFVKKKDFYFLFGVFVFK